MKDISEVIELVESPPEVEAVLRRPRICPDCDALDRVPWRRRSGRWVVMTAHEVSCPRLAVEQQVTDEQWQERAARFLLEEGPD